MKVAVLSGKGGTGKTLISVNLAAAAGNAVYIDCDVEEPNGHLYFKPKDVMAENISIMMPLCNDEKCDGCRKCVDFCKFGALAYIVDKLIVFEEVCHSCGGCTIVCPPKAISEKTKVIGEVRSGYSEGVKVISGIMNTGEASGVPITKSLLDDSRNGSGDVFIDCPPGSACIVMESIKDADYCILVAEPTVFGAYNLAMVHELVKIFNKPHGVVLNKCLEVYDPSEQYCMQNSINILARIPYDTEMGLMNSNAEIVARTSLKFNGIFSALLDTVRKEAGHETAADS